MPADSIYDPLRRKLVARTPEEEVRQWFVTYLINQMGYPAALVANEVSIIHNGLNRRCDTVVYDNHLQPVGIVEYKAPCIPLTPKVFDQIVRYNMVLGVKALIVTNSKQIFACKIQDNCYTFLPTVPRYEELI